MVKNGERKRRTEGTGGLGRAAAAAPGPCAERGPRADRTYGPGAEPQGGAVASAAASAGAAAAPDGPAEEVDVGPPAQPVEAELLDPLDPASPLQACPSPAQPLALPFRLALALLRTSAIPPRG
jgi:hypothetical protein